MSANDDLAGYVEATVTTPVIDFSTPNMARVYDALVGGTDNFEADRAMVRQMVELAPHIGALAVEHRQFLSRTVRFLADMAGIDQFLDLGSGLPTAENTHEVAQHHNPETYVVYVDNDPVVQVHARALLAENDFTHVVAADVTYPRELLAHPTLTRCLDLERPLGLILSAVLHHIEDTEQARRVVRTYVDALPSGSYVMISHQYDPADGSERSVLAQRLQAEYGNAGICRFRSHAEIMSFFDGLELIEPGLSYVHEWWPDGPRLAPAPPVHYTLVGGLARKP